MITIRCRTLLELYIAIARISKIAIRHNFKISSFVNVKEWILICCECAGFYSLLNDYCVAIFKMEQNEPSEMEATEIEFMIPILRMDSIFRSSAKITKIDITFNESDGSLKWNFDVLWLSSYDYFLVYPDLCPNPDSRHMFDTRTNDTCYEWVKVLNLTPWIQTNKLLIIQESH